jgi:ADP-ribosylglycohydrolase
MFDTLTPSKQVINLESYKDKVLGCWTGKNIGGTLGAPFEGKPQMNNVNFYTQKLEGKPIPNDDLDLQLIWLLVAEEKGLYRINERVLGEYWLTYITNCSNEYGICKSNLRNGLMPPLSGSCNNDRWKFSNGAWIRSEIWACILPGSPDEAAMFAYYDACCDHCGEGIYAEVFITAMESAAFIIDDIRKLIEIGLSKIPVECRIAKCVKLVIENFDKNRDFRAAREALLKETEDMGWFQAPLNIGFVIIGLLYGNGDFGSSICIATNCGDDTDCTAATVGSILGIVSGRSGIPEKWIKPIGESIVTCSIDTYKENKCHNIPSTLEELSERVVNLAILTQYENCTLPQISKRPSEIDNEYLDHLKNSDAIKGCRVWNRSPYELTFELPYGHFSVDYENGPEVQPGERKKITLKLSHIRFIEKVASIKIILPDDWKIKPGNEVILTSKFSCQGNLELEITPGKLSSAYEHIPVEIRLCDRFYPIVVHIPFQRKGSVNHDPTVICQDFYDVRNRCKSRSMDRLLTSL